MSVPSTFCRAAITCCALGLSVSCATKAAAPVRDVVVPGASGSAHEPGENDDSAVEAPVRPQESKATDCERKLGQWVDRIGDRDRVVRPTEVCHAPCRKSVRLEVHSPPLADLPAGLSRAQQEATALGIEITEWEPQEDGSIRFGVVCFDQEQ
ncbi:MAG: hypothetical protein R3B13_39550 [Polyangiaceae bacterium]